MKRKVSKWRPSRSRTLLGFHASSISRLISSCEVRVFCLNPFKIFCPFDHCLSEIPEGPNRYKNIAHFLNERGIKAYRGGEWTAENVRKQLMRGKA
jgi:hypothetical protein